MKHICITTLIKDNKVNSALIERLKQYGLKATCLSWHDDLEKMSWIMPRQELVSNQTAGWILLAPKELIQKESIRYGLSLLIITVLASKGTAFPILTLTDAPLPTIDKLPTPFRAMDFMNIADPAAIPRLVTLIHNPTDKISQKIEYRLDVYGNPQIGQWFEVGPTSKTWEGAMFGVSEARISFHAVGTKGGLPQRSTLNYPIKDMKVEFEDMKFLAWGLKNRITDHDSYYVKVEGWPKAIIFGAYPELDTAEVYMFKLK